MRRRSGIAASCEVFGDTPHTAPGNRRRCLRFRTVLSASGSPKRHCRSSFKNQANGFIRMKLSGKLEFAFCYEGSYKNQRCSSTIPASIDCAHPDMHRRSGIAAVPEASVGRSLHNPSMVNTVGGVTFRGGRTDTLCGFSAAPVTGSRLSYTTSATSEEAASSTFGMPRRAPRNQRILQTFRQR